MQIPPQLTKKQLHAIELYLNGETWVDIATMIGVSSSTLYNWRTVNEDFRRTLDEHRKIMKEESLKRLASINTQCFDALQQLLKSENEMVVCRAVATELSYSLRAEDSLVVEAEIKELADRVLEIRRKLSEKEEEE